MGFFIKSKQEAAEIRGVADDALPLLSDNNLVILALARLYEANGVDDGALIGELYRRGRSQPNAPGERLPAKDV